MAGFRDPVDFSSRASAVDSLAKHEWRPEDAAGALWRKTTCAGTTLFASLTEGVNGRWELDFPPAKPAPLHQGGRV